LEFSGAENNPKKKTFYRAWLFSLLLVGGYAQTGLGKPVVRSKEALYAAHFANSGVRAKRNQCE